MRIKTAEEMLESAIEEELMEAIGFMERNKRERRVKIDIKYSKNVQLLKSAGYKMNEIESHANRYLISW